YILNSIHITQYPDAFPTRRSSDLQIEMANIGLSVCASHCEYRPIKLITSMRTTDSLSEDESYFYSELKRLQYIVGEVTKDKYFIDRKSTRLNSSHVKISYAVFCLK